MSFSVPSGRPLTEPQAEARRRWSIQAVSHFTDLIHARESGDFNRGLLATKALRCIGITLTLPRRDKGVIEAEPEGGAR